MFSSCTVKDDVKQETSRFIMVGYEHSVRTFSSVGLYLCYSIHAELLDVLGLLPRVCGVRSSSVRFLWTRSCDVNVQTSSTLLTTLGLWVGICLRHST